MPELFGCSLAVKVFVSWHSRIPSFIVTGRIVINHWMKFRRKLPGYRHIEVVSEWRPFIKSSSVQSTNSQWASSPSVTHCPIQQFPVPTCSVNPQPESIWIHIEKVFNLSTLCFEELLQDIFGGSLRENALFQLEPHSIPLISICWCVAQLNVSLTRI